MSMGLCIIHSMKRAKRLVDVGLTTVLLLLMGYALVGEVAHEVLGCAMFALMIIHMAFNANWYRSLGKGRYSTFRLVQTVLDFLILGCMLVSLVSGLRLAKHLFESLGFSYSLSVSRLAHLLASHWGFCLMSIHLGMHWMVITAWLRKRRVLAPVSRTRWKHLILGGLVWTFAAYGLWAFVTRDFWRYMVAMTRFAFFDYEEPLALFLVDHLAIMTAFILLGFFLARETHRIRSPKEMV